MNPCKKVDHLYSPTEQPNILLLNKSMTHGTRLHTYLHSREGAHRGACEEPLEVLHRFVRAAIHLHRRRHNIQAIRILPLVVTIHDHLQQRRDVNLKSGERVSTTKYVGRKCERDALDNIKIPDWDCQQSTWWWWWWWLLIVNC